MLTETGVVLFFFFSYGATILKVHSHWKLFHVNLFLKLNDANQIS